MRPVEAVIFDKDGVLVDFERTWTPAIRAAALHLADGDEDRALELLRMVGYDDVSGTFLPGSVWAAGTNEDLIDVWAADAPPEERARLVDFMGRHCEAVDPVPVVDPRRLRERMLLLKASGLLLAVVSNDTTRSVRRTAEGFGIADLLDFTCGYDSVPRGKPHPDPALAFAEACGVPPARIAVIGDNVHDGEMARAAGCGPFIGVLSGNSGHEELAPFADAIVADALEAADLVAEFSTGSIDAGLARL